MTTANFIMKFPITKLKFIIIMTTKNYLTLSKTLTFEDRFLKIVNLIRITGILLTFKHRF